MKYLEIERVCVGGWVNDYSTSLSLPLRRVSVRLQAGVCVRRRVTFRGLERRPIPPRAVSVHSAQPGNGRAARPRAHSVTAGVRSPPDRSAHPRETVKSAAVLHCTETTRVEREALHPLQVRQKGASTYGQLRAGHFLRSDHHLDGGTL